MAARSTQCGCIRCREVRGLRVAREDLRAEVLAYEASGGMERFLSFGTTDGRLAGYLRLWLPGGQSPDLGWRDLQRAAIVRDVHVYGQTLPLGGSREGSAQHLGLGTELLTIAEQIARESGFPKLAVISAIGTRDYYRKRGYEDGELYLVKKLG
jgi:elongator complex protein 3